MPPGLNALESNEADGKAWLFCTEDTDAVDRPATLRAALSRMTFTTVSTTQPLETLVEKAKQAIEQNGRTSWRPLLAVAGRGRIENGSTSTLAREMAKMLSVHGQIPDVGAEIRKTIGDVATALAITTSASIMVVQAGTETVREGA
jgi:hypothetical protein